MSKVRVVHEIGEVSEESWDAAVSRYGGSVYHRHAWLRSVEAAEMVDIEARHLVLEDEGRIVGLAPLYLTRHCPKLEMFRKHYVTAGIGDAPMLIGHSMYAQSSELLAAGEHERGLLLDEILALWQAEAADRILAFPLVPGDSPLLSDLRRHGFTTGLLSCTNLLETPWDTFEGYLAHLPGTRRRNITKGILRSERAGVTAEVQRGCADLELLASMVRRTAEHHGSPVFFDTGFLTAVVEAFGSSAVTITVRGRGEPILTCLALDAGGEVAPWCIGFDYTSLGEFGQYNYLYATLIRFAVENGRRQVNFGRSTYYIKRKYGCRQRPVYAAMAAPAAARRTVEDWVSAIDAHARTELAEVGLPAPAHTELLRAT
jgi:predicted N-acyltransferase